VALERVEVADRRRLGDRRDEPYVVQPMLADVVAAGGQPECE
jgi:hypothetical protein